MLISSYHSRNAVACYVLIALHNNYRYAHGAGLLTLPIVLQRLDHARRSQQSTTTIYAVVGIA